jgi:hypothetical protein
MDRTYRFAVACFVVVAAVGCGKGSSGQQPADTTTAAPTPPPPPPTTATAKEKEKPKDKDKDKEATPPPAGGTEAGYRWETHKQTNIKFEIPTDWSTSVNGNQLVAKTPTPGVGIEFQAAIGGLATKHDEKAMLKEVNKSLTGAKYTKKGAPVEQHGLKGFVATGTGKKDGKEVEWFTSALGDGHGHEMLTLGFYAANVTPEYKAQLMHVLDSIQPAK